MKKSDKVKMECSPQELIRLYDRLWYKEPVEAHIALVDFIEAHLSEDDQLKLRRAYKETWDGN